MSAANDATVPPSPPGQPSTPQPAPSPAESPIPIQPVPPAPASTPSVQAPPATVPKRPPLTPERLATEIRRLDLVLAGVVLLLAFFLASFPATNSDLWM